MKEGKKEKSFCGSERRDGHLGVMVRGEGKYYGVSGGACKRMGNRISCLNVLRGSAYQWGTVR